MRFLTISLAILAAFAAAGLSISAAPPRTTANLPLSEVHDREILVELDTARGVKSASAFAAANGLELKRQLKLSYTKYEIVRVPDNEDYYAILAALEKNPQVKSVGPNVIKHASKFLANDPLFLNGAGDDIVGLSDPYVKNNQWGLLISGAPAAWDVSTGVSTVIVAMLDTGINFEHEDLVNRIWKNAGEIAGNGVDDDHNGFIDDTRGWDFSGWNESAHDGGDNDPTDPSGSTVSHGNATASIVGAQGNNGIGITGVAGGSSAGGGARLMILRVGTETDITVDAEIGAIDYAIGNGAKVISMSFGGVTGGPPEENAVNRAWNAGLLVVAAAGNEGQGDPNGIDLPAGFLNCMAVGATTVFNTQRVTGSTNVIPETLAGYSKTGPQLDIVAPGTHIMAAGFNSGVYTDTIANQFTGTSAATPLVAGLGALLFSANPGKDNAWVRSRIQDTARDLGANGWDEEYGWGRIDIAKALVDGTLHGDTNGDGHVTEADVQPIIDRFGAHTGDTNYQARVDTNTDGVIDEVDLFAVGRNFGK